MAPSAATPARPLPPAEAVHQGVILTTETWYGLLQLPVVSQLRFRCGSERAQIESCHGSLGLQASGWPPAHLEASDRLADGLVDDAHLLANLLDFLKRGVNVLDLHLLLAGRG